MNLNEHDKKAKVTDIALMIRGFTIFSFTYMEFDGEGAWQLVILNRKKEHNF